MMKSFSLKVDLHLAAILERNASEQGAKLSRYIRSLIEKGLVVDEQLKGQRPLATQEKAHAYLDIKMAEFMTESLVLLRKYAPMILGSEEQAKQEIAMAQQKAKEFVAKALGLPEEL